MDLKSYITGRIEAGGDAKRTVDDWKSCLRALDAFLGPGNDIDILRVATTGWVQTYWQFLIDSYRSNKTRETTLTTAQKERLATDNMAKFRRLVIRATEDGLLPNIDVLAGVPGQGRRRNVATPAIDHLSDFRRLIASGRGYLPSLTDRYLVSLMLVGTPMAMIEDLLADIDTADEIMLPHLGMRMPLSPELKARLVRHRQELNARRQRNIAAERPETAVTNPLATIIGSLGLKLYAGTDPFADWLILAQQIGLAEDSLRKLIDSRFGSFASGERIGDDIANITTRLLKEEADIEDLHWYGIRTYGKTGEDLMTLLNDLDVSGQPPYRGAFKGRTYCPCREKKKGDKSRKLQLRTPGERRRRYDSTRVLLKNILFLRTTSPLIRRIDQQIGGIWIFRSRNDEPGTYTRIPSAQLYNMMTLLNHVSDYSDVGLEIGDVDDDQKKGLTEFAPQQKVKIRIEGYEGFEAEVSAIDKGRSTPTMTYYTVDFLLNPTMRVRMSVPAAQLTANPPTP